MIKKILVSACIATSLFTTLQAKGVNPILSVLNTNEKLFVVERENKIGRAHV